ncbi:AraC family transcriptional regulator [Sphingobacterium sp. SRCM116780]|uniref:AraC family transcriptional regulator n=1 Tax=Sphingobacterium sp. SRCM116780 TaxID=2907623 RepID=UPI001F45C7EE|nr:AraC family transcriptional regulator [Sphingobacterium sp. SRCM116780]UIR54634.1 AraC family transcriptional regulator [Sphingobacterium sp. SRCM116780]
MKTLQFNVPTVHGQSVMVQEDVMDQFYPYFHQHHEAQLMWIIKGSGVLVVEDTLHSFKENDIFFLGANQPHVFKSMSMDDYSNESRSISIFFDPKGKLGSLFNLGEFETLLQFINNNARGFKVPEAYFDAVSKRVIQLKSSDSIDKLMHFFYLLRTLSMMSKDIEPLCVERGVTLTNETVSSNRMHDICNYIKENYKKELTLEEVANQANLTPQAFCRYFKKHCGLTFVSYLNRIRVREVCSQLNEEHLDSVSFVAYNCGFNSITNFNRVFKQIVGCNPKEYVQNYKKTVSTML